MYYSFDNEDKIIRERFFPDYDYKGVMVEVGAGPPTFLSNSKHFRDSGWRTICIDPNPKFVKQHKKEGSEVYQYACSNTEGPSKFTINYNADGTYTPESDGVSFSALDIRHSNIPVHNKQETIRVETIKLNTLLDRIDVEKVDVLSIDVEGWEMEVLAGFSIQKYQPDVIMLENLTNDPAYSKYMGQCGYYLHDYVGGNQIFISKNLMIKTSTHEETKRQIIDLYTKNDAKYGTWGWCSLDKAGSIIDCISDICSKQESPVCVEIGVYGGRSTFPVAMELKRNGKGVIHAIDPWSNEEATKEYETANLDWWGNLNFSWIENVFRNIMEETGTSDYINIHKCPSDDAPEFEEIDYVYIDGQHTSQAFRDVDKYASKVRLGGYCLIDDVNWGKLVALPFYLESLGFEKIWSVDQCFMYRRTRVSELDVHVKENKLDDVGEPVDDSGYSFYQYPHHMQWPESWDTTYVHWIQHEILRDRVYRWYRDVKEGDVVVDFGSSCGAYHITILDQKPSKVYAVDGDPDAIRICKENTKELVEKNNVSYDITRGFFAHDDSGLKDAILNPENYKSLDAWFTTYGDANLINFSDYIAEKDIDHIDFLKMDMEGGEYEIFSSDGNVDYLINNVEFIAMECHLLIDERLGEKYTNFHREKFIEFRDKHLRKFKAYKAFGDVFYGAGVHLDLSEKIWDDEWVYSYNKAFMLYLDNGDNIPRETNPDVETVGAFNVHQQSSVWIVDNFYKDPHAVREFALKQDYHIGGLGRGYIGNRTHQQFLFPGLKERFESIMGKKITAWQEHGMNGRFQWCVSGQPQVWHCDSQMWGGMLYLTPDAPYAYGTTMYANKKTRARNYRQAGWDVSWVEDGGDASPHLDGQDFEPVDVLGNVFNRLVIFDAANIHSSSGYFGTKKDNCRLWQMFFFDTEA